MIKTKVKQWGNSIGLVIPKEAAERMNLKLGEDLVIEIKRKENPLRESFGSLRFGDSKKILKEVRKEMESKWM
ncbi:AbrB/MazE/SpoVT family DNA-binding domain-containing protein [Candidatus Pacearchaeota archaeon]|nr:AbrB/MazE/SpoVT family DNA-binding domain-containing protein [Candidatus Pacearchaeota archaeon]